MSSAQLKLRPSSRVIVKVAIVEGHDIGGTCVNRGCVPSKALLAAAGEIRKLKDQHHLKSLGIQIDNVTFEREKIAGHANNLAKTIQGNLKRSMESIGVVGAIVHRLFFVSSTGLPPSRTKETPIPCYFMPSRFRSGIG